MVRNRLRRPDETPDGAARYSGSDDQWGNIRLADYARLHKADVTITLHDVWVLQNPRIKELNLASWVPVDHKPCPPLVAKFFKEFGARPIAMSRFGEQELKTAGLDPLYVPHAVDTFAYRPYDRGEARKMLGIPEDAFLVGMVANNAGHTPSRKAFPQAILAFSQLRRMHEDAFLYLHTEMSGMLKSPQNRGVDIFDLCDRYGVPPAAVKFTDPVSLDVGLPTEALAQMYSAFDVLLNPSYGEGFGVPLIEAQACGTPILVTDWTSMPELCGAGWMIGGEPWDDVDHRAFYMSPNVDAITGALEEAYKGRGDEEMRTGARDFALGYDADHVFETYWKPALEELTRPREVAPLPGLNREQRRRLAKQKVAS